MACRDGLNSKKRGREARFQQLERKVIIHRLLTRNVYVSALRLNTRTALQ